MNMLQINSICPLGKECCDGTYDGIAFDGCNFYITTSNCSEIYVFDYCFCKKETISTCRPYTSICYDCELNCFWAISNSNCSCVFKLDKCLNEIDCISIPSDEACPVSLTSVSCACDKDILLISTSDWIAEIEKYDCPNIFIIKKYGEPVNLNSVTGMYDSYIAAYSKWEASVISICTYDNNFLLKCYLPRDYKVKDFVVLDACSRKCAKEIYILASKHCSYPYILKCVFIENISEGGGCLNRDGLCSEIIKCQCDPCCDTSCYVESLSSIIESIALLETSLSHILNAEGEKIQKILECTEDASEIIEVNEAVNNVIINIAHLEYILYTKLQIATDLLPKPCEEPCEKDKCKKTPPETT